MCTVGVAVALTAMQGYMQYQSIGAQYESQANQYKAQQENYERQAETDRQNAAIEEKKAENTATSYAQQSETLRDKRRIIAGQNAAQVGASGLSGAGSALDVMAASNYAYQQDQNNLLFNQRNSVWDSKATATNYRNQGYINDANASTAGAMVDYTNSQGKAAQFGSLLGTASSIYGLVGTGGGKETTAKATGSGESWSYTPETSYSQYLYNTRYTTQGNEGNFGLYNSWGYKKRALF